MSDPDEPRNPAPRATPPIPENAGVDLPPEALSDPDAKTEVDDPDKKHRRRIEKTKLRFAIAFTCSTAAVAVALGLIQYFTPGYVEQSNGVLASTSDVMKLLATTSLGYIFGRTMGGRNGEE